MVGFVAGKGRGVVCGRRLLVGTHTDLCILFLREDLCNREGTDQRKIKMPFC
jgi:hypothetical protein